MSIALAAVVLAGAAITASAPDPAAEVRERERAFAQTMADRSLGGFAGFLSKEAIFIAGSGPLRGPDAGGCPPCPARL